VTLPDLLRTLVIFTGGTICGGGTVILMARARFYKRRDLPQAAVAMYFLVAANALVLSYITTGLITHWGNPTTWRLPLAMGIYLMKGLFFHNLRGAGLEQDRRILYGETCSACPSPASRLE